MKSLVNSIDNAVTETLLGLSFAYPQLEYQASHKVFLIPKLEERINKVSIICGGGSGHEPFAAGFVGNGMLTAAVAGSIFAAPPSQHITYCINRVTANNKAGVLVIIPNYTGDCLNFGIAVEKARNAGLKISEIIVNEDCSIPREEQGVAGKRGLTGLMFVIKIAGALAEKGLPLEDICDIAKSVVKNMATYAVGLTACAIPGQPPMFELAEDEVECGMGIHGEAGYEKRKLRNSSDIISLILKHICEALSLRNGDSVAVIVNNFGALSQLEQGIVVHDVIVELRKLNIQPVRVYWGLLMTSLNSAGVHITLLKLSDCNKDVFISCLDDFTNAPRWPGCAYSIPLESTRINVQDKTIRDVEKIGVEFTSQQQYLFEQCLKNVCARTIEIEDFVNDLDRGCGDGDCGTTLRRLASEVLKNLSTYFLSHPSSVFSSLAQIAEQQMGGTSGALYCLFFTSAAGELVSVQQNEGWTRIWARVLRSGLNRLMKYGNAKPGDRSMIDVLNAVCEAYENMFNTSLNDICVAVTTTAWQGCETTKYMKPKVGRASYVQQAIYLQNVDAGAYAIATWIDSITDTIKNVRS